MILTGCRTQPAKGEKSIGLLNGFTLPDIENMNVSSKRKLGVLGIELSMFLIILLMIWLDEYFDLPNILFAAPPRTYRFEEFIIEAALVGSGTFVVMAMTLIGLRRIERLENYLRVCAWCKSVWAEGKWMSFEKYLESAYRLRSTHGICEKCHEKIQYDHADFIAKDHD